MEKDYNAKPEYREGEHGKAKLFTPFEKQGFKMSGRGWLHNEEHRYVLIEDTSAKGKKYIEVYQKVGTIFNNDQREEGSKKRTEKRCFLTCTEKRVFLNLYGEEGVF